MPKNGYLKGMGQIFAKGHILSGLPTLIIGQKGGANLIAKKRRVAKGITGGHFGLGLEFQNQMKSFFNFRGIGVSSSQESKLDLTQVTARCGLGQGGN